MARLPMTKHEAGRLSALEVLSLSAALTIFAVFLPDLPVLVLAYNRLGDWVAWLPFSCFADLAMIAVGLMLTLPAPRASGLCIGSIRQHWWRVLFVAGGPILLTAIVYPNLPERPFAGASVSLWLTSPLAQDLIFGGVIYRLLRPHFMGRVHPRLPFEWALPIGGCFFAAWHLQNLAYFPATYVAFQLLYTWAAYTFVGLTRQWTGSLLYVTLAHMTGNYIAWVSD